jgi:hypothetical protein
VTLLRRASDRLRRDERGTSLVEMMVVIMLTTMILTLAASTMILGQRMAGSSAIRLDNSAQTRLGMETITKLMRTAVIPTQLMVEGQTCVGCSTTMVISASATSISFYANVNNNLSTAAIGPSRVTYSVVQDAVHKWGNLVEQVQAPQAGASAGQYTFCAGAGCAVQSRVVARGLQWPAAAMFTYYDATDAILTALPLSSTDLGKIDSIDVGLVVRTSTAYNTPSTSVVQRVALSNASSTP